MKLQHLSIIFVIIILPISLVLSAYIEHQTSALNLQTEYDSRLISSTYDAVKAFQLNTLNNSTSNVANSKIRDIEAATNTFFTSLSTSFGLSGYRTNAIKQYVPALVFTMYDGYYIYTPFENKNGLQINDGGKTIHGLKPYVYYSCRYIEDDKNDIVITYSLDNYITIQGKINGTYVNDAGYLIDNITVNGTDIKYNGIEIKSDEGELKQNVWMPGQTKTKSLPYIKENGTTYYWDKEGKRVFYILNGKELNQATKDSNQATDGSSEYDKYCTKIEKNNSAYLYYKEAYKFTNRVRNEYQLDKWDSLKNAYGLNLSENIFKKNNKIPIEYENSTFNIHRQAVIRHSIETNLSAAIAGYNQYSKSTNNFQMPKLQEDEWNLIMNNVSVISFLQGINTGGNMYNGYAIVTNNANKEVVQEEDIYIVVGDEYHKITDIDIQENLSPDNSYGALSLDFKRRSTINSDGNTAYYYPESALACYNCVVNQSGNSNSYDGGIYEYIDKELQDNTLKQKYYTALGRERYGSEKQSRYNNKSE